MTPFLYDPPAGAEVPIIISSPHSGLEIPDNIQAHMVKDALSTPDADLFVDRVYDFASDIGCHFIRARYSRYVVDLNRDPRSRPLYDDGRQITPLVPTHMFDGQPIYRDSPPDQDEIEKRTGTYYEPYHRRLRQLVEDLQTRFQCVLLFDGHSIARVVPTIQAQPFSDLILGSNRHQSCHRELFDAALGVLGSAYQVADNSPFQGGYITRHFGDPQSGVHTLQLEMCKDLYLDETLLQESSRAGSLRSLLRSMIKTLAERLPHLP